MSRLNEPLDITDEGRDDPPSGANQLSVLLVAPADWSMLAVTLRHLQAQTARERLEIVIVAESVEKLALDGRVMEGFAAYRVVEAGPIQSIAWAYAKGVRAASTPLVAFAEDHSFPAPGWAAALIDAHRGSWAAVGPLVLNANPATRVSWADFLMGYGPWTDPSRCGERDHLPGHNSSYKRHVLLECGADLEGLLEAETVLQWKLRDKGHRLCQSVGAHTRHTNFSLLPCFAAACFLNGRSFAASRANGWSIVRKAIYAAAFPLIPAVRLWKIVRDLQSTELRRNELRRALPALILGLALDAIGQLLGYALGRGNSTRRLRELEFNRANSITRADREALFGLPHWNTPGEVEREAVPA